MRAIIHAWHTEVFPTDEEVKELCRPGEGANTCSWLLMGTDGWECCCLCKSKYPSLLKGHNEKTMSALRDGCDKVNNFNPVKLGDIEF